MDTEKYLGRLKDEENLLRQKIKKYEEENNNIDNEINAIMDDIASLERSNEDLLSEVNSLNAEIAEASSANDKFKSESLHFHRATQNEVQKNNDLNKALNQAEGVLKTRICQVEDGRRQVEDLRNHNGEIDHTNDKLNEDMEFCRRHLESLSLLNGELLINLEKYSEEDDVVRNLLDRKNRIARSRAKVDDAHLMSTAVKESSIQMQTKIFY